MHNHYDEHADNALLRMHELPELSHDQGTYGGGGSLYHMQSVGLWLGRVASRCLLLIF